MRGQLWIQAAVLLKLWGFVVNTWGTHWRLYRLPVVTGEPQEGRWGLPLETL